MSKPEIASAIAQHANERLTKNIQRQLSRQEYAANKKRLDHVLTLYLCLTYPYEFRHYIFLLQF